MADKAVNDAMSAHAELFDHIEKVKDELAQLSNHHRDAMPREAGKTYKCGYDVGYNLGYAHACEFVLKALRGEI